MPKELCGVLVALEFFLEKALEPEFPSVAVTKRKKHRAIILLRMQGQVGLAVRSLCLPRDTDKRQRGEKGKTKFIIP